MTVLASVGSQQYTPQTATIPFSVAADATRVTVSLTHPSWPEGPVLRVKWVWPTGESGTFQTSGGLIRDKTGNPTGGTRTTTFTASKPPGVTSGTASIEVLQTLTTAVLVESS